MHSLAEKEQDRKWVTRLAGAYLILLYIAVCAILGVFGYVRRDRIPGVKNYFPSLTPTATAAPHILVHQPVNDSHVFMDDFSVNTHQWYAYYWYSKVEVLNGKLVILSNRTGYSALAVCEEPGFSISDGKYYLQADVTTNAYPAHHYGLAFGMDEVSATYYLFEIMPQSKGYSLIKHSSSDSTVLLPFTSTDAIRPYPETNTLSVYFDNGKIELYVNGKLVSTYLDHSPSSADKFGAYVDGPGFELLVNNFFAFSE